MNCPNRTLKSISLAVCTVAGWHSIPDAISDDGVGDPALYDLAVVLVFLLEKSFLEVDVVSAAVPGDWDDEESDRDNKMRDELVDLDEDEDQLSHELVRGQDVDAIELSAGEVAVEVDIETQHQCPQKETNSVSSKDKFDLVLPLFDVGISDGLEAT